MYFGRGDTAIERSRTEPCRRSHGPRWTDRNPRRLFFRAGWAARRVDGFRHVGDVPGAGHVSQIPVIAGFRVVAIQRRIDVPGAMPSWQRPVWLSVPGRELARRAI